MVRIESRRVALSAAFGALGGLAMLTMAPAALADPAPPTPDPGQPVPVQSVPVQPMSGESAPAPVGIPHLPSPDNLPPGTTENPTDPPQGHGLSYLRDLWHAVQTQDVSGGDALLLLTQRPMDPDAMPPSGLPMGPQPVGPVDPAAAAPPAPSAEVPPAPVQ